VVTRDLSELIKKKHRPWIPPLWRKTWRELMQRKWSLAVLCVIMGFGVSCFVGFLSTHRDLQGATESYYRAHRFADVIVDMKRAPSSALPELYDGPNVSVVRGRIALSAVIDMPGAREPIGGQVISMPVPRRPVLNDLLMMTGAWFSSDDAREVIVTDAFAKAHGLKPGDRLKVLLLDQQYNLLIVGTAVSPEFIYLIPLTGGLAPDPARFTALYLPERFAQETCDLDGAYNQVLIATRDREPSRLDETVEWMRDTLDPYGVILSGLMMDQSSPYFLSNELENLRRTSQITPVIFLAVAAMLLNVLVSRLVAMQRGVVGTLKAIGYSRGQIFWHYIGYGVALGIACGIIGCVLGFLTQNGMLALYRTMFSLPEMPAQFHTEVIVGGFTIALIASCLGTLKGTAKAIKLEPAEAMRPAPPEVGRAVVWERFPWLWKRLGFDGKLVLRDIGRNPFRTGVSIVSGITAAMLILGSLSMRDALFYLLNHEYTQLQKQDYSIAMRDPRGPGLDEEDRHHPIIAQIEPMLTVPADLINGHFRKRVSITGLPKDNTLYTPLDSQDEPLVLPEAGLVMTKKLAEILHVAPGDTVTFQPLIAERRRVEAVVVATVDTYFGLGCYGRIEYLSRLLGEPWVANQLDLKLHRGAPMDLWLDDVRARPTVTGVTERLRAYRLIDENFSKANAMIIGVFVGFACIIGMGSMLNAALVTLSERARTVGTLRVLGYTPQQVARLFRIETWLLFGLSIPVGLLVGIGYVDFLSAAYSSELARMPAITLPIRFVQSTILMVMCITLSGWVIGRWIVSFDWLEAMKIKE